MAIVVVTGSSGFIGSELVRTLRAAGHEVRRLVRSDAPGPDAIRWDPATGSVDCARFAGVTAVVHLAGENVAGGRWTAARRARIRDSRGPVTARLCRALADLPAPPALLCASAIGIYGDRGDEQLTEQSAPGRGFLAEVAQEWENGAAPLAAAGARVVHLRIGMVLGRAGGALRQMLLPFRLGLGGRLGSGRQYVSWIALADLAAIVGFLLARDDARGTFLCVAPAPVTNREFTRVLARVVRRPAFLPVPAVALRLLFGGMADEVLLASQRAVPRRLVGLGHVFLHPDLEGALRAALA